jgi:hypothetical protein
MQTTETKITDTAANETDPKVLTAFNELRRAEAALEQAKANFDNQIRNLRTVSGRSTFCFDGQFFQIRERKGQVYLCVLDGKPQGRKPKNADPAVEHAIKIAKAGEAEIDA